MLDYGATVASKTKSLDDLPMGWEYGVTLRREFLAEAQKATSVRLDPAPPLVVDVGNGFSREFRPFNSEEERTWLAIRRIAGSSKTGAPWAPGEFASSDGRRGVPPPAAGPEEVHPGPRRGLADDPVGTSPRIAVGLRCRTPPSRGVVLQHGRTGCRPSTPESGS